MLELQSAWLLWLAPLPLLMHFIKAQKREEAALRVPFFNTAADLRQSSGLRSRARPVRYLFVWLIWLAALLAATNPQWVGEPISMPSRDRKSTRLNSSH